MTCHCWLEDDRMSHVKGVGTSVLQPQGIDSANNLNEPGTGISPEPPDKSLGWSTPWFWSRELLSRGPVDSTWTSNSQKLWNYKFVLFKDAKFLVICYGSNRKVIHLPQIKIKSTPESCWHLRRHALLQGIFLTQGLNLSLFMSPALAGRFFTTSATWEVYLLGMRLKFQGHGLNISQLLGSSTSIIR